MRSQCLRDPEAHTLDLTGECEKGGLKMPDEEYICQFCGYRGSGWLNGGQTCPVCHRDYDALLAQDSEE